MRHKTVTRDCGGASVSHRVMQNDHPGSPRGRAAAPHTMRINANLSLAATRHPPGGGAAFLTGHWDSHCELDFRENGVFFTCE